jgi:hypothetical protein
MNGSSLLERRQASSAATDLVRKGHCFEYEEGNIKPHDEWWIKEAKQELAAYTR